MRKNGNNLILSDFRPDNGRGAGVPSAFQWKRMFHAIFIPTGNPNPRALPTLGCVYCTRGSQVANLSVIILKAKETWANLYAGNRRAVVRRAQSEGATAALRIGSCPIPGWLPATAITCFLVWRDALPSSFKVMTGSHNKQASTHPVARLGLLK